MNVSSTTQTQYTQATNKTTAIKASSAYESTTQTQSTDKMDEMKEKYKDIYTPIPETYSKEDEELQTQKVYEAYPKYMTLQELWDKSGSFYEGEPIQLGVTPTKEQENQQKIASKKMEDWIVEEYGSQENLNEIVHGAQDIKDEYPVNTLGKDKSIHNSKELSRFFNAAVYESLEDGKDISEAKKEAGSLMTTFMDTSYMQRNFVDTLIKAGRADPNAKQADLDTFKPNFDAPNNATMDLRKYGIEGEWRSYNIYENKNTMIAEIEKKMGQYNFMLNNESLVKGAYTKLDASYQDLGNNVGYKKIINDDLMPMMNSALNVFKNYKIYDSVDIKG
jgi:hypothetical protein